MSSTAKKKLSLHVDADNYYKLVLKTGREIKQTQRATKKVGSV